MNCECTKHAATNDSERKTLRIALCLNGMMFIVGMAAGLWTQSTGLMADALDMLADASAYALGLMAVNRSATFKKNSARWSGSVLLLLGLGIVVEVARKWLHGSDPQGLIMMVFALLSLFVNVYVLRSLSKFRQGEVHLRATWIFTKVDVIANLGVFASGVLVHIEGWRLADLVIGVLIGSYVIKEAAEILQSSNRTKVKVRSRK